MPQALRVPQARQDHLVLLAPLGLRAQQAILDHKVLPVLLDLMVLLVQLGLRVQQAMLVRLGPLGLRVIKDHQGLRAPLVQLGLRGPQELQVQPDLKVLQALME